MTKCLIVQPIHPAGLERLSRAGIEPVLVSTADGPTVRRQIADCDAVVTRNAGLGADAISAAPKLRVISVHGVGIDPVAIDVATQRGILVTNTPHANVRSVAEQAISLMLSLAKSTVICDAAVRRGDFDYRHRGRFVELEGSTFGVVGLGNTGRATAHLAKALGMRVVGFSRTQSDETFSRDGVERCDSLDELLAASDVVSLHLSLTAGTRNTLGAREFSLMKSTAFLVNTARGGIVDDEALAAALREGRIAGAGLDVFALEPLPRESPLATLDNVVLSPHTAGSTEQALRRTASIVAEQVIATLDGKRPRHLVNPAALRVPTVAPSGIR